MGDTEDSPLPSESQSTCRLLDRARAGDRDALDALFVRHLKPLQRWARGRLPAWARDLADTDDLVQNTLLQTFKRLDDFEPRHVGALQAYMRQTVLNRIRDELRRKGRHPEQLDLDDLQVEGGQSPFEAALGREKVERYEKALERLQPTHREAIIARIELGYIYEELAAVLKTADAARKVTERAGGDLSLIEPISRGATGMRWNAASRQPAHLALVAHAAAAHTPGGMRQHGNGHRRP
jgi:RNA polymerase sigma-70 factor (ECF subfamily)